MPPAKNMFHKAENIFQTIFETLPTAAIFTNTEGKIIKCNQAALSLYEKDSNEKNNSCSGLTCLTEHPRYLELVEKVKEKGVLENIEICMVTAKGNEFMANVSAELVKENSKSTGIVFAIKDISDLKKKEEALKHRFRLEKIVASISTQLIVEPNLNKVINNSLAKIAKLNHASRGYVFLTDEESRTISNTHEWCMDGITSQKELLQNLPLSDFPWWIKTLQKGEIIHIEDTSKMLKRAEAEKRLLLMQDIKSLLVLPLFLSKKLEGFVAFDNVQEDEKWTYENIALLKIYGDILGKAIGSKKAVEALQKSEKRFSDIAYSTGDWIWELDINGYYTYSNIAVEEIIGYKIDEVIGRPFYEFYLPDERERLKKDGFEKFWAKKEFKGYVSRRRHKNGSTVFIETSAIPILGPNGFEGYRGTNHDITESKNIENILRQEHHKLEAVTENVGVGLAIINKNYEIVWQNGYLTKIVGIPEGKHCFETFTREKNVCENCGVKKVFEEGLNFDSHVFQTVNAEGKRKWIELIVTPIFDENGKIVSAIEMAVDITEKKVLENQLAEYSVGLETLVEERTKQLNETQAKLVKSERLAAIGELAGMVGHDIRNPLTGIKNAAYYLESKGCAITDEKRKMMISIINKSINQANKIVNDLLDYSREIHLEYIETTPKIILQNALANISIPENVIILDRTREDQKIVVDSDQLERVFVNLLNNAIEAMPEKGTITITSKINKQIMEISFTDSGTGISKENTEKMFTPLFTTKAKGMGLGLAICKRIVEAHEGKIMVESKQGKGTTFTVRVPLKPRISVGGESIWVVPQEFL